MGNEQIEDWIKVVFEPCFEKTKTVASEQVQLKPSCTNTMARDGKFYI